MLSQPNANVTLFAPCDAAFSDWPSGKLEAMTTRYVNKLKESLLNHMVAGRCTYQDLVNDSNKTGSNFSPKLKTVSGAYLFVLREAADAPKVGELGLRISKDRSDF